MDFEDIIATIFACIFLLTALFLGIYYFVKFGIEEFKQNKEIRQELIKFLKKQNKEGE